MGHENVGVIAKAGREFVERHGLGEGDRVFVEHYVGCYPLRVVPRGRVPALRAHRLAHQPRRPPLRLHLRRATRRTCGAASRSTCTCPGTRSLHKRARRRLRRARRHRHAAVQRHRVGAVRRRGRLRVDRADPGPGPAGAVAGRRLQAGRRLARSSSPAPPGTPPGWSWPRTLGADHVDRRPAGGPARAGPGAHRRRRASTSSSTAPPAPAPRRCCSASTRSSAARARWSSRASWPRSPTSRSRS